MFRQWVAWATAGRPYSGHRDHQDVHPPQGLTDINAPGEHKVRPWGRTMRHFWNAANPQMRLPWLNWLWRLTPIFASV